jgi:hypothetical protein
MPRWSPNPNYYIYNRNFFEFGRAAGEITLFLGDTTNGRRRCSIRVSLAGNSWVDIELECYAQILTAKVTNFLGNLGFGNMGVTFTGSGVAWNGTSASFTIPDPIQTLPIRVYGEFSVKPNSSVPYILVPFDYTITGLLPFEEMGQ